MRASRHSTLETLLVSYARNFPIRRGKLRLVDSLWRAAAGNHGMQRLADLKHGGFKMPCDLREMLQRQFYFFGTYFLEEEILECWQNEARHADIIFDVGANAGIFSLAALAVQGNATVHAFEPTPEIADRLRQTATLNRLDRMNIHEMAVYSENRQAALRRFRGETGENEGMNFITAAADPGTEMIQAVCLDRFCMDQAIERVDLLKIDIQGQEHQALAGAAHLLSTGRVGTIFTELNWAEHGKAECPASESIRILENAGYRFSKPGRHLEWQNSGEWMRKLSDIVARRV